jgi:hypothetical protein
MPCDTPRKGQSLTERVNPVQEALKRLERYLSTGSVRVVISDKGAINFTGWKDRDDVTDVCAYRTLSVQNSWALRQAVARAEAQQRRKVNPQAVAAGWHSHDGGKSWSRH